MPTPPRPPSPRPLSLTRRHLLGAALATLPLAASAGYNFWTGEYTLTHHELQAQVNKKFPLQLRYSEIFEVRLAEPRLTLDPASNRVGLAAEVFIRNPFVQPRQVQGVLALSSGLKYDPSAQALRLEQPTADQVTLQGLSGQSAQQLQSIGALVAQELLRDYALYTFKPEELRRFGKTFEPGEITVEKDRIRVAVR